ncbi:MAG: hypothetical protein K9L66_05950 [Spirochaetaceae bacterium]|nr:hypothetical protein [Spirochaetaceae bacterium]MCF7948716.1 hypothetical protein [Spirochaetia bacterium]MCF7951142.1 hypothetical protein [Spirochaetaceae bacterium]
MSRRSGNSFQKKKVEEPTFYCETCGLEVGVDEDECPHCGMPFYGVRCPRCGFNGKARQFVNGCPQCGFRAAANDSYELLNNTTGKGKPVEKSSLWLPLLLVFLVGTAAAAIIVVLLL